MTLSDPEKEIWESCKERSKRNTDFQNQPGNIKNEREGEKKRLSWFE